MRKAEINYLSSEKELKKKYKSLKDLIKQREQNKLEKRDIEGIDIEIKKLKKQIKELRED